MTRPLFTIFFIFLVKTIFAQPCNIPFSASNTCADAPLVCTLDGYCSSNSGSTNTGTPNAFCGIVENNSWVKFIAGSTSFELQITVDNCNLGNGLQAQFLGTNDCTNFFSVSNCLNPVFGTANLTCDDLTIGEVYYLMMDGKNGDVCNYQYELVDGEILSPASVIVEPFEVLCPNESLTINSSAVSPNSNLSYQWSTSNGNIISGWNSPSIEVDTSGIYEVFVQDDQGCSATGTTQVEVTIAPDYFIAIEIPDILNCVDNLTETLSVNTDPPNGQTFQYDWTTSEGDFIGGEMTATPEVGTAGWYYVTVINNFGCSRLDSVQVFADVDTPMANAGDDKELNCLVSSLTLGGELSSLGSDFSYEWTTIDGNIVANGSTLFPTIDAAGSYQLEVTNSTNGCTSIDNVVVSLNEEEPLGANIQVKQPCYGEINGSIFIESVLGGIPPYAYAFDGENFSLNNLKDYAEPGNYNIIIRDDTGCEWETVIEISPQPELIVDLGDDQFISLGCEAEVQVNINFPREEVESVKWSPDLDCAFPCLDTVIIPLNQSTYTLELVDINGCVAKDTITYYVKKDRHIYIPNAFTPNDDGINDRFVIYGGKDVEEVKIFRVFDRWGELLVEYKNFPPNLEEYSWDGQLSQRRMNENVFLYYVEILFKDGWEEVYTGDVTLHR